MSSIIVVGKSGSISNYIAAKLRKHFDVDTCSIEEFKVLFLKKDYLAVIFSQGPNRFNINPNDNRLSRNKDMISLVAKSSCVLIYLSSIDVYDFQATNPWTESSLRAEKDFYSSYKIQCENEILDNANNFVILRLPVVWGTFVDRLSFIETMIVDAVYRNFVLVPIDSDQLFRSLLHVESLGQLLIQVLHSLNSKVPLQEIWNAADIESISLEKIVDEICAITGAMKMETIDKRSGRPNDMRISTQKLDSMNLGLELSSLDKQIESAVALLRRGD